MYGSTLQGMPISFLTTALLIVSVITNLTVEGIKKLLDGTKVKYSSNVLAAILSVLIACAVSVIYLIMTDTVFTMKIGVEIVVLMYLGFLISTVGYDKVIQMLKQMSRQNCQNIYGGRVLIDLTGDTVDPSKLLKGSKAHDKSGAQIEGACTFDVDSTDATAVAAEILFGKTAYVSGNKLTGTMKNNGAVTKKITTRDEEVTIPQGFHDGSGKVGIDATEKGKLIANNIREGVTILGVEGTMSGSENMKPQAKTVTPSTAKQTILPDTEYNCLSQVEVEAIPYVEADNPAGGVTVTIAG